VYGSEEKVSAAKAAILELLNTTEVRQAGNKVLVLPPASIALIIGAKGATVREMQEKTGARFDFDRVTNKCSLKGRYGTSCASFPAS
jgi:polyribonucleotide nucleotidyltransferase